MFSGIGFGAERLGLSALKFPKTAAFCLFSLLIAIGFSLPYVTFDDDIHRVVLSDSPLSQAQRAYENEQTPPLSTALIHVTSPVAFSADDMTILRDMSLDLEFIDGVTAIASPFVLRWPPETDAPSGRPLFGEKIDDTYSQSITEFEQLQTGLPLFLNPSLTAMLLSVSIDKDQATVSDAVAEIKLELERALPPTLSTNITGEDVISAEIVSGLKGDLISLNLWGALIVTFAAFALLRDLRMALLAVVPASFAAAGVLALSVWLGFPITVLSNVIPILLLVLGVADGVHLAGHIKGGGTVKDAVIKVGPACALTALTTAVAFASIMLTGNAQLFEFAVLGTLGTLLSFAIVIVTFALLAQRLKLSNRPIPDFSATIAKRLADVGLAHAHVTIFACLALLVISIWGFGHTKAWFPHYQNLPNSSVTLATNDAISADFGGVFQMIVEMDDDWDKTRDLVKRLDDINGVGTNLSEVNFARWLGHPDARPTVDEMASLPESLTRKLRTDTGAARVFVSVPEPMRSDETLAAFDRLYSVALQEGADRVMGLPTVMRLEAVRLINQLSLGLVIAALGATLLVALAFRSISLVPVLIIPNVLPLVLTGASLHIWAHGELSPTAVLALTISFGIAIDDTVHFLNRYSTAIADGRSTPEAIKISAESAGRVMVLTTLLLSAGLSVTMFSGFIPIRLFGGMMIFTLWAALLVDLMLLPALLSWRETKHAPV